MKTRPRSRVRNKISYLTRRFHRWLENETQVDMRTNGEKAFLNSVIEDAISPTVVIFDVGANEGEYARLAEEGARKYSRRLNLHAFEPAATYSGPPTLNKMAVSDKDGTANFFYTPQNDDGSSFYRMPWNDRKDGAPLEITVPTIRLDTYIDKNKLSCIDLLKIDVEGHELPVLTGLGSYLRPDFTKAVQFEYVEAQAFAARVRLFDFVEFFNNKGYDLYKLFPAYLERFKYDGEVSYANFAALPSVRSTRPL